MLFNTVVAASLAAAVFAAPLENSQHKHHAKRDAVTVTNLVTIYGEQPAASAAAAVQSVVAAPVADVAQASSSPAAASSSAASSGSSGSSNTAAGAGGAAGVVYSPYAANGQCKTADEVKADVAKLSGFPIIRIYGVDCNQVSNVLAAKQDSQKIFAGVFSIANVEADLQTLATAVKACPGGWDNVHTVSIGNEWVNGGIANPDQVKAVMTKARSLLASAGYTGSVVSVDTFIAVLNNPALCELSDYIAINAHAFFDSTCQSSGAGEWALHTLQSVSSVCDNSKKVMITECGWPHQGSPNGKAVPSKSDQEAAISSIKLTVGDSVILFTAEDDLWKSDSGSTFGAEKYWGFIN